MLFCNLTIYGITKKVILNLELIKYISGRLSSSAKRQRFQNFSRMVALISVTLGSIALLISLSVLSGFEKALREKAIKSTSHIKLFSYNRKPLPDYPSTIEKVKFNFPEIKSIAPSIEREGLIRSDINIEGILIRGIKTELDITNLNEDIVEGRLKFSEEGSKELIIGRSLARKLNVHAGDSLVLYAMREQEYNTMAYPDISKFIITGVYETGMSKYDDMLVYIPFKTAAMIFNVPDGYTLGYEIMLNDIQQAKEITTMLEEELGYPYYGYTVFELHGAMFAWIELQKEPIPIVLGLISIVAVFNILTILLITVVEKTKTIGILRTLGLTNKEIMSVFIYQGSFIGLTGAILGSGIALAFCLLQQFFGFISLPGNIYFVDSLPVDINPYHYLIVIISVLFLSFISTLIPALVAVKVNTISALRFR